MKKFAAFDIDGTLFRSGLYREVARELMKMGVLAPEVVEEATQKNIAYRNRMYGNAFEEFETVLVNLVDQSLPTIRISDYETAAERVIAQKADNVYVYTRDLIKKLKSDGYFLIAISGSQAELVEPFAERYGFDAWIGQEWERGEEFFTGNVTKTHTGKDTILRQLVDQHDLTFADSYAVGDSNGDAGMLGIVDHPIAMNPTYELFEKAVQNGWKIVVERKNISYTLERSDTGDYVLAHVDPYCA